MRQHRSRLSAEAGGSGRCEVSAVRSAKPRVAGIRRLAALAYVLSIFVAASAVAQPAPPCAEVRPLACGETLQDDFDAAGVSGSDCFTFDAQPGETVSVSTARHGGVHMRPAWEIVDATGAVVDFSCRVGARACRADVTLTGDGPYTVVVYEFGLNDPGEYSITLEPLSATFAGAASCAQQLDCGVAQSSLFEFSSDVDSYRVDALAGEVLSIAASRQNFGLGDPAWRLYDADGSIVASECHVDGASCESIVALTGNAPYTLAVADFELDEPAGGYSVSVQSVSSTFGGTASCAAPLGCGATVEVDADFTAAVGTHRVSALPGETVVIATARQSGGDYQPAWRVYDASGALVSAPCDDAAPGCRAAVRLSGPAPYTIKVAEKRLRGTGGYSVSLAPASLTFGGVDSCAAALGCGGAIEAELGLRAGTDAYGLSAAAGDTVFPSVFRESGGRLQPGWTVYDADGNPLDTRCASSAASCRSAVRLDGRAPFTMVVGDDGLDTTGDYSLGFEVVSSGSGTGCASELSCGDARGAAFGLRADSDAFRFDTPPGDIVSIVASRTSNGTLMPAWSLFDSGGSEIGRCENGSATCAASAGLTGPGPYTLAVYRTELGRAGTYALELTSPSCCDADADCSGNPCLQASCNGSGFCPVNDGAVCDDGIDCTGGDVCLGAMCAGTDDCPSGRGCDLVTQLCTECVVDADCDDANPCTKDFCDFEGECDHLAASGTCDDGVFCNGVDRCSAGTCSTHDGNPCGGLGECATVCNEEARICADPIGTVCTDDGSECTADFCDGEGGCAHPPVEGLCDDGLACTTGDVCVGGRCRGEVPSECIDDDPCSVDSCSDDSGCVNVAGPSPACRVAGVVQFKVRDRRGDFGDRLSWKWQRGAATYVDELGNPAEDTTYTLCVFDSVGGTPVRASTLTVPPDADAWLSESSDGWLYRDRFGRADGVQKLRIKTGSAGKARVDLMARGPSLPTPAPVSEMSIFAQDPSVVVQLVSSEGVCWIGELEAPANVDRPDQFGDSRR